MTFQDITAQALSTNYSATDIFDDDEDLRLATIVVNRDAAFEEDVAKWGHTYTFKTGRKMDLDEDQASQTSPDYNTEDEEKSTGVPNRKKKGITLELDEILCDPSNVPKPLDEDILGWIEISYRRSRGFEIGTFNFSLLSTIMKRQSYKWTSFAHGYISDVIFTVHSFIVKVLKLTCHDDRVCRNLLSVLMDSLTDKYKKAVEQVEFILHIERTGTLKTLNHYFNEQLEKWFVISPLGN